MCITIERLLSIKSACVRPPLAGGPGGETEYGSWCKEEMSGCLVPASSQMFCGSLCKPTCICLLAFQNVCYHCIHYGLGRSWTPSLPNKLCDWDVRYFNAHTERERVILLKANCWRDVVRLVLCYLKSMLTSSKHCILIIYTL